MPNTKTLQNYDEFFTDDKLNIKSNVIDFAHLIEQDTYKVASTSKVYSISAEFGMGKTFFCDKLQQVLLKDKVKVGKLNIWETDFYENLLIPILAELNRLYCSKGKKLPSKIVDSIGHFSANTLSSICEISARIASNTVLGVDAVDVCKEKFSSETIYDDYSEYQKALKELKTSLTKWSSKQKDKRELVFKVSIHNVYLCAHSYSDYGNMNNQQIAQKFNQMQTSESVIKRYFAAYSECFGLSLRQMEQFFDRLYLFTKQINASRELFSPDLATFLICLHEYDFELFKKIRKIKNFSQPTISAIFANNVSSIVYKMYKELAFEKFKPFNREIASEVIPVISYSYKAQYGEPQKIITDNIDRFYVEDYEMWMYQQNALDTQDILTYDNRFDREVFKENYCRHIDFIAHFE